MACGRPLLALLALFVLAPQAWAQPVQGTMEVRWNAGARDCASSSQEPLQVHAYEPQTFILRQNPCVHFEANFIYLLIGARSALLIDTGAVAEPESMPLAATVMELLPDRNGAKLPLLVVHTHSHRDHRTGDVQFESLPFVTWPDEVPQIDLGGRMVHVIPTPGHNPNHVVFYDERTALLFSGDFLLPGRLLVDDAEAYRASAVRVIDFLADQPLVHILGAHIELDADGKLYRDRSRHHPNERRLELGREDLWALPAAFDGFNGFRARHDNFVLVNPINNLIALAVAVGSILALIVLVIMRRVLVRPLRKPASDP